jgi:hypothetical protein
MRLSSLFGNDLAIDCKFATALAAALRWASEFMLLMLVVVPLSFEEEAVKDEVELTVMTFGECLECWGPAKLFLLPFPESELVVLVAGGFDCGGPFPSLSSLSLRSELAGFEFPSSLSKLKPKE